MSNEEHEGVTLTVDPVGWPKGLVGVRIGDRSFLMEDGLVKIECDPIWDARDPNLFQCQTCGEPRLSIEQCETCGEIDV